MESKQLRNNRRFQKLIMLVCKLANYDVRMVIDCFQFLWTYLCTGNLISKFCKKKCANTGMQWWILGEANEAVASGPPSKIAHTVLNLLQMFVQRTIPSEDLFFF